MDKKSKKEIESWWDTFTNNNYEKECKRFNKETGICFDNIIEWVKGGSNNCDDATNYESIKNIYLSAREIHGTDIVKFLFTTSLADKSSLKDDSKWILNSEGDNVFKNTKDRLAFLLFINDASCYYKKYNDVIAFTEYVYNNIETNYKGLNTLVDNLWTVNIKSINKKIKSWFPDADNDINIFDLHLQLLNKYKNLKVSKPQVLDKILQVENVGGIQNNERINLMDEWLEAIKQFDLTNMADANSINDTHKSLLEKSLVRYEAYVKELRNEEKFPQIQTNVMLAIWHEYIVCFEEKLQTRIRIDNETFSIYKKNISQTVPKFDVTFRTYRKRLIEVLNFEQIKYMYIMLLIQQFYKETNDHGEILKTNNEKLLHITTVYHRHALLHNIDATDGLGTKLTEHGIMTYQIKQFKYILNKFYIGESVSGKVEFDSLNTLITEMQRVAPTLDLGSIVNFLKKQNLLRSIISIICHSSD